MVDGLVTAFSSNWSNPVYIDQCRFRISIKTGVFQQKNIIMISICLIYSAHSDSTQFYCFNQVSTVITPLYAYNIPRVA